MTQLQELFFPIPSPDTHGSSFGSMPSTVAGKINNAQSIKSMKVFANQIESVMSNHIVFHN
jgi:hypothetical protein